nr:hypothetical protein [Pseudomonas sp. SJZ085]
MSRQDSTIHGARELAARVLEQRLEFDGEQLRRRIAQQLGKNAVGFQYPALAIQ